MNVKLYIFIGIFFTTHVLWAHQVETSRLTQKSSIEEILPPISASRIEESFVRTPHSLSPRQWTPRLERSAAALTTAVVEYRVPGDFLFDEEVFSSLQPNRRPIHIKAIDAGPSTVQLTAQVNNHHNTVNVVFDDESQIQDVQLNPAGGILFGPMRLVYKLLDWIKPGWSKSVTTKWLYALGGVLFIENFLLGSLFGANLFWIIFVAFHLSNFLPYLSGSRTPSLKEATINLLAASLIATLGLSFSLSPHDVTAYILHATINAAMLTTRAFTQPDIDAMIARRLSYSLDVKETAQLPSKGEVNILYPDGSKGQFTYDGDGGTHVYRENATGVLSSPFIYPIALAQTNWPLWQSLRREYDRTEASARGIFTSALENRLATLIDLPEDRVLIATRQGRYALAALFGLLAGEKKEGKIRVALPSFTFWASLKSKDLANELFGGESRIEPVFIDIDPKSMTMDLRQLEEQIKNVDAVLTVDIFGNVNDFKKVAQLAHDNDVVYYHDGAHNVTAQWNGTHVCTTCDGSIMSLSFTKAFTGGQFITGGALILPKKTAKKLSLLSNWEKIKMPDENALPFLANISDLDTNIDTRNEHAQLYRDHLGRLPGIDFQHISPDVQNPNHTHFVMTVDPEQFGGSAQNLIQILRTKGIEAKAYFEPLHIHHHVPKRPGLLPQTEKVFDHIISLPFSHDMTKNEILHIVHALYEIWQEWNGKTSAPPLPPSPVQEPPRYVREWVAAVLVPILINNDTTALSTNQLRERIRMSQYKNYPFVASYGGRNLADLILINQIKHTDEETHLVFRIHGIPHSHMEFKLNVNRNQTPAYESALYRAARRPNQAGKKEMALLTHQLIQQKKKRGQLKQHPLMSVQSQTLDIPPETESYIKGKTIMITGATGLVGSQLAETIKKIQPKKVLLLDNRTPSLTGEGIFVPVEVDIQDKNALNKLFAEHSPHVVFHLAAIREPRVAEENPRQAIGSNMIGTMNLAELANDHGVERFVYASNDQAAQFFSQSVYGSSKILMQDYIRAMAGKSKTRFSVTRFRVIAENSMANQVFQHQATHQDAITLFEPRQDTRRMQSAQQSVASFLIAGLHGEQGEIFIDAQPAPTASTMDIALFAILESKRRDLYLKLVPAPPGNAVEEFPGFLAHNKNIDPALDLSQANPIETDQGITAVDKMIRIQPSPFNEATLMAHLNELRQRHSDPKFDEESLRNMLKEISLQHAKDKFSHASTETLIRIVNKALNPKLSHAHFPLLSLLLLSLAHKSAPKTDSPGTEPAQDWISKLSWTLISHAFLKRIGLTHSSKIEAAFTTFFEYLRIRGSLFLLSLSIASQINLPIWIVVLLAIQLILFPLSHKLTRQNKKMITLIIAGYVLSTLLSIHNPTLGALVFIIDIFIMRQHYKFDRKVMEENKSENQLNKFRTLRLIRTAA